MPPTIQNGNNPAEKRPQRPAERKSELINKVKYCNTLPDIPFDLKFITYPFENDRFIQYNPTSLERNYRYEVLTEHDLGVTIDLINRDLYQSDPYAQLDPADEKLLEEDVHTPQDSMRSKYHAKSVSWLRKSEYISTEQTRFQPQTMEKVEAKVGFNVKKAFVEETLYMDRETQIVAIQKTFDETKAPLTTHYSKPNVTAVESYELFPDFSNWKFPCAQVIFDSDPAEAGKNVPAQIEEMSQAMIRGVMDESGEQFVAYFLPSEDTLEKRRRDVAAGVSYEDDEEYEYKMAREYNWNVKSKASKGYEENYFLVFRPDGVYYNELETRVRLNKRRQKVGTPATCTKLIVKHLPLNASEHRMQRYRERQLEAPGEEEEMEESDAEDEEDEEEEETAAAVATDGADAAAATATADARRGSRSRSHSASRSRSPSPQRGGRSVRSTKSKSRVRSGSESGSHSGSGSRSPSPRSRRSKSRSQARQQRSTASKTPRRSRSHSGSGSGSGHSSRSGSARSGSGSRSGSAASRRRSRSGSRSASRSGSGSPAGSRASRSRSRSHSGSRSGSGSQRSRSGSAASKRSGSAGGSRSRSGSPRSGSGSPRSQRSGSARSGSGSASE